MGSWDETKCICYTEQFLLFYPHSFQNEEPQTHLLEFLKSVAESYRSNKRAGDFIPDVLRLNVPLLFAAENEPGAGDGSLVGDMFSSFLREYIQRNNLHPVIMNKIQDIIGYIADKKQHAFHWIVLNVLQLVSMCVSVCVCLRKNIEGVGKEHVCPHKKQSRHL